jgi:hypothetical protein
MFYLNSQYEQMSTMIKKFFISATFFLTLLLSSWLVCAQSLEINITLLSPNDTVLKVEGKIISEDVLTGNNWSFLRSYADVENLGQRVEELQLFKKNGDLIVSKKFADGEFVADQKAARFSYLVKVGVFEKAVSNAHLSWVNKSRGLLMLNDLLPNFNLENQSVRVSLELPENWRVLTTGKLIGNNTFLVAEAEDAVFLIGEGWRTKELSVNQTTINFAILGKWQFEDEVAFQMANQIFVEYERLFGGIPVQKVQIILMDFPVKAEINRWRAETRGANVTILSSQTFAESLARQRLHEQLRHEIFHLWIPNTLNLSGDYAWFYEGFAIYQALKTGVWLGQIRFEDFLNTLEQAYFLSWKRSGNNSLIDISKMRWNGEISSVYAKGMVVAFLADGLILDRSKGRYELKDIFREIYQKHGFNNTKQDANSAVLAILQNRTELLPVINKYIKGIERIDWTNYLEMFGIENLGSKINANLRVKRKLSGRQKALLKKLGYNRRRNFKRQKVNQN